MTPLPERFWAKVDTSGDCWEWTACKIQDGYGHFFLYKEKGRPVLELAHRTSWRLAHGPIPGNLYVLHKCDNPGCVNPDHLFLGSHQDNMMDKTAKRRHAHGEKHSSSRLTEDQVKEIKSLVRSGVMQKDVAGMFGVARNHVSMIMSGKKWSHVS